MSPYRSAALACAVVILAMCAREACAQAASPPPNPSPRQSVEVSKSMVEHVIDAFSSPIRVLTTAGESTSGFSIGGGIDLTAQHERLVAGAKISTRGYWRADVQLSSHPTPWSYLKAFGTMRHLPALPYYGLGPDTSQAITSTFDLDDRRFGGGGWVRRGTVAFAATGDVTWAVSGQDAARAAHMRQTFAPGQLVGFGERLTYFHSALAIDFNNSTPVDQPARGVWYRVTGHRYVGLAGSRVALRVLDVDLRHYYPLPGRIVLGTQVNLKVSPPRDAAAAPFFLLPYLGGDSTLEGFADYRFRDATTALIRFQGRRSLFSSVPIWKRTSAGPLYLVVFVDAGTVANTLGKLNWGRLHYDAGFGLSLWMGASTLLRFDFAFSIGEGFRTKPFTSSF